MNLKDKVIEINEHIKKMADLLRSGNTMLNMACPVCNNPIFREKEGNTFCPTCNRKVLIVSNNALQGNIIEKGKIQSDKKQESDTQNRQSEVFNLLHEVLIEKIEFITQKLKNENQLHLIETYTNILTKCFDILSNCTSQREKN